MSGRRTDEVLTLMLLPNETDALLQRWMLMLMVFVHLLLLPVRLQLQLLLMGQATAARPGL